ncbi:alpha-galactosidase [Mucilaginibacter mali]|uniref:Alpha-galactosidase n=2 Tax=Mucilaginibacter mali TaxID=2740462 RepID=A0A7D4UEA2_9SPHI|nr:alpha-galactosidase [Mucilaginibacter mali]
MFCCSIAIGQTKKGAITELADPKGWVIETRSSAYQLYINSSNSIRPVFYGSREQAEQQKKNAQWFDGIEEVPVRGNFPFKTPALEVIYADNVRDAELEYVKGEVIDIEGRQTLKITQKDKYYPLEVTSYIRVLPEFDILEKWMVVKNTGTKGNIKIENAQSGSIVLPADEYMLTHLAGKQMNEFQQQQTLLTPGLKVIQSKAFKANFNPPWFMVRPQNAAKDAGPAWFGSLHYSGNWDLTFDKSIDGNVQILGGINFWDSAWQLVPGASFETPKLSVGYTNDGPDGAAQNMAAYARKTILPARHRNDLRPVLYNNWEATFYAVNEDQQLELAKKAKDIGIELFVIDDGWFKGRTSSTTGLGDWEVDKTKFPNGLGPMIKKINDMGMDFGIWIEPESLVPAAEVYKNHPDWVFDMPPNRTLPITRRYLNLAKEDVYQHLLEVLSKLLAENNIKFIKWDQNSYLSETGWKSAPVEIQREVRIRFMKNVYRLVDELKKRFPNVWFESCASGGGRVDLGMLSRMDQAWVSDDTSPLDRIYMQYGYLWALPANTMVSWVTGNAVHQSTSLDFKFDVSMAGVLAVGDDLRKWNSGDMATAAKKIAEYKVIRPLVQQGTVYHLVSPFEENRSALQYSDATTRSAVICYNMAEYLMGSQYGSRQASTLKLKGLKADQAYIIQKIEERDKPGTTYKGAYLMNIGIEWPVKGANKSQILLVTPKQ